MSPSSPRIGYVVKMFPRLSETFIRNEVAELQRQGLTLRIFSLKRPPGALCPGTNGAAQPGVVYLPQRACQEPLRVLRAQWGVLCRYPAGYARTLLHVLRGRELRALPRGLRRFSQTCCLVHALGGARHLHAHFASDPTRLASWARMICGISYSVSTHAKDLFQDSRIGSVGLRFKLGAACFVVANSDYSAAQLVASLDGHPNGRPATPVVTVYNGVDLDAFPRRAQDPAQPLILSVGRLVEKKGFEQLIRACGRLKERGVRFDCEIVGTGPLKSRLQQEIAHHHLESSVILRGEVAHEQLLPLYQRARIFALPCVVAPSGDRDLLPNVLKEAMAVGVPVVTTRLEGIGELVMHGETGVLVAPENSEELAEALEQLLSDEDLRRRLAHRARRVIEERFDMRPNFGKLKDLLLQAAQAGAYEGGN